MQIDGDKVQLNGFDNLEWLAVCPLLEIGKEYKLYNGAEYWGKFVRRGIVDGAICADYSPVQPLEYITTKIELKE